VAVGAGFCVKAGMKKNGNSHAFDTFSFITFGIVTATCTVLSL
jgi:hypothetical protein